MRVFVINLDKNTDRLVLMDQGLRCKGVIYERFPAIYGKDLSAAEKNAAVNRFAWWCTQGYPIRDGQIGCALSHSAIYRKMVDEDIPVACILEDDAIFDQRFFEVLSFVETHIDVKSPHVVLLHNHYSGERASGTQCEIRRIKYERCAESYVLTREAAECLLTVNTPVRRPCDHWFDFTKMGLELFQAFPTVCSQRWNESYQSDVYVGECVDTRKFSLPELIGWKLKRAVGKLLVKTLRI